MKILLVDDHTLFREGLAHILHQLDDEVEILEAYNYESAQSILSSNSNLDLMLLDLNMPGKDGFSLLKSVGQSFPTLPVAILSASRKQSDVDKVLATSAMGYFPKDTTSQVMLSAVRMILAGGIYTPPTKQFSDTKTHAAKLDLLTPRQQEVLEKMVLGESNKQISAELSISLATTKMHVTGILKSLGVSNRTQATLAALKLGFKA